MSGIITKPPWHTKFLRKPSTETVNNSTSLQDDNDLQYSFVENGVYRISVFLSVNGVTSSDIKVAYSVSGGVAELTDRTCRGMAQADTDVNECKMKTKRASLSSTTGYATMLGGNNAITEDFLIQVTSPGTLKLRWAQDSASENDLDVYNSSYMLIEKIKAG
jgi:hypothetical protein